MTEKQEKKKQDASRSDNPLSVSSVLVGVALGVSLTFAIRFGEELKPPAEKMATKTRTTDLFAGMNRLEDEYDLVVVGAGLSGAVIAERASTLLGLKSLIIEKRNHIGGNCYDYIDEHGIRISQYGVHIFHTKYPRVEEYVKKFSEFVPYEHRVVGEVKDINESVRVVPIPPNIDTVNTLFGTNIQTEQDMVDWLDQRRPKLEEAPRDGEEMSISRVGRDLYERIFKPYTKKQWDKWPKELDASVLARLPVRTTRDDRYFNDPFQALPKDGYTAMFENMILNNPNITVRLNVDYFSVKEHLPKHSLLVYTGPIDAFYASKGLAKLEYRSIFWEKEYIEPESGYYQPAWVVNHPSGDVGWTRISEYKHSPNQPEGAKDLPGTVIFKEYSTDTGDPYYPVPNPRNQELYEKYQKLAENEPGVTFVGRLASYKYFNMDQAILNALDLYDNLVESGQIGKRK